MSNHQKDTATAASSINTDPPVNDSIQVKGTKRTSTGTVVESYNENRKKGRMTETVSLPVREPQKETNVFKTKKPSLNAKVETTETKDVYE
jgi:hypothetical protein